MSWSIEETIIRAQSLAAVAAQGVWDVFTHRPAYSNDHPIPGCPSPSDCRGFGCAGDCSEAVDAKEEVSEPRRWTGYELMRPGSAHPDKVCNMCDTAIPDTDYNYCQDHRGDDDAPNIYEPALSDSELVGVRGLLQERYETSTGDQCSGSVEHPAGGLTHSPRVPPAGPQLDWHGWALPAIYEVLSEHQRGDGGCCCGEVLWEGQWDQHAAPLIAARLACDPARAIAALHNHKPQ